MTKRKDTLMHDIFGTKEAPCKDCTHFRRYEYRDKLYRKCDVYGITNSEATDWAGKYQACGLFPDKQYRGVDIVRLVRREKLPEMQADGQMSLFKGENNV